MVGTAEDSDRYHTVGEFKATLDNLTDIDWWRLRKLSENWCRNNRRSNDAEDVLQEAILRVFDGVATGKRQWPRDVKFVAFMSGVMKSIASERPEAGLRPYEDRDIDDGIDLASDAPEPEAELNGRDVEAHLMSLFEGDDKAQLMLMAWSDGEKKSEILSMNQWEAKQYEAVRKRIRRTLNKHPELREMIG